MDQSKLLALQLKTTRDWGPKHKIFLSHSGVQKPFTEHLYEKLEAIQHYEFLDKRLDCLPKGEKFYPTLMKVAEECLVAILVLSDEFFTNSKWPMMELNTFVKAQELNNKRLKILPLFFKMSRVEFEGRKSRQEWMRKWEDFKKHDESIDLHDWMYAVSKISGNNGIEYAGESEGESEFIKKVVAAVCKLDVPPDVKWDTSHFQSVESLLKPVLKKIKEVGAYDVNKVGVMGLYGVGGVGKTTFTRELCNIMSGEFVGKVCHVELGGMNLKEQMKAVLKDLTSADAAVLDVEHDKLGYLLKERMGRQKVFLVLDNIWDKDIEEVEKYLEAGYHDGSMVLLVSRSLDFLEKRLGVPLHHCMEMPNVDEEGAIDVFLHYTRHSRESIKSIGMWETMKRCVEECYLTKEGKGYAYHPLALKALGTQLKEMIPDEWEKRLKDDKFNLLKDNQHPIFGSLRKGYDVLDREEQHIFLDLALLWTNRWRSGSPLRFEWLCTIHRRSEADMKTCVDVFLRKGLLKSSHDIKGLDFAVHDLYVEFAEKEAQVGPFEGRRFLLYKHGTKVPHELLEHPRDQCWPSLKRFVMHRSRLRTLKRANLKNCKNVEVLDLDSCEELEELDVTGMSNLRCIVVTGSEKLERLVGFDELSDLVILRFERCPKLLNLDEGIFELEELQFLDVSGCESLTSLVGIARAPALQELKAQNCRSLMELPDDFSGLKQLQSLDVSGCGSLTSLVGIARAPALQEVKAQNCQSLMELPDDFSGLKQLQSLDVSGCGSLTSLVGIARAPALQEVKAQWCSSLMELPDDFSGLKRLKSLDVRDCESLSSLVGIARAPALQEWKAQNCGNLMKLPDDFSGLKRLKSLDVSHCHHLTSLVGIARAPALQEVKAQNCWSLMELPDDFSGLKQLQSLDVSGCGRLTSLVGIARAPALQELKAQWCSSLMELPDDFSGLKRLKSLDVRDCESLTSLVGIARAPALQELKAQNCRNLMKLPDDFSGLKQLQSLDVSHCHHLTSLVGIARAPALQEVKAQNCRSLMELPDDFSGLKQLQSLDVSGCGSLTSLVGIARAPALQEVKAQNCRSLMELPDDFSGLKQLQSLDVSGCGRLTSLVGIARALALQELKAQWCSSLMDLPDDFSGLKQLQSLDVRNCESLTSLGGIACAEALQELKTSGCSGLKELPCDFSGLRKLKSRDVRKYWNLTSVGGVAGAEALQDLKARGCFELRELCDDFNGLKHPKSLDDQSHGADMLVDVDNVEFQVGTDDMGIEDAVDVDDDAQECKDELLAVADFQDIQAANAMGVPSSSTIVLEDQTHELEMPEDVDNVESILITSTDVGGPSSFNANHGYSKSSGTMWALTRPDCSDSSAYAQGNAAAMEQLGSYLRLGKHCLEAVQSGTSSLKFNIDQCGYLADKLQMVVWSASAYLDVLRGDPNLSMDVAEVVEVFKFLRTLAKQIESFVHGCCQQSWIQSAMMLTNVWEYVASVGFNLELCRAAFCRECGCLSLAEVEEIHKVEVEVVKKKAFSDVDALSQKILLEGPSLSDEDKDLSFYLLRRLNQIRPIPGVIPHLCDGSIACDGGWIGRLYKWVKPSVQLGRGASGTVHKAMWLGTPVARKTFFGQQNPDFMKEVEILSALSHPNVMSMFCSGKTNRGCCAIIMELMDEDLHMLMERRLEEKSSSSSGCPSPFPILEAIDLMLQIGEGGKYLHDQGIAHRDLKAMNILAKNLSGEDLDGYVHVKVADFGLSKTKEKSIRYSTMSVNVGSNRWMAPEIIRLSGSDQGRSSSIEGLKHPLKRDIYSYGMVCFEILTGRVPFPFVCNEIEVKRRVLQGGRPELPEDPQQCPVLLRELIESCWSSNPKERPTFMAICSALKYLKYLLMRSYCQGQKIYKVS